MVFPGKAASTRKPDPIQLHKFLKEVRQRMACPELYEGLASTTEQSRSRAQGQATTTFLAFRLRAGWP